MLRRTLTISLTCLSLQLSFGAHAGSFDYLPSVQGPESEVRNLMNAGDFKSALLAWNTAHGASQFGQSANGQATLAYLLYQNGMPLAGLDLVLGLKPQSLSPQLLKTWTTEIKGSTWIKKGWMQTSGAWKKVSDNEAVSLHIRRKSDIAKAFARADRLAKDNVNQKARIWWQIATQAPQINQVDQALRALKLMRESGQTVVAPDQISSAYGRNLYQKGDLDAAIQAFNEIPKSSNLWIESVEERAWTHFRRDDFDKALGETVTLLSPAMAPLVGPESYYLTNLMALKVCDYPRIFKNSELFKQRHKNRLAALQELVKTGTQKNVLQAFEAVNKNGVTIEAAGAQVEYLPRAAFRDQKFVRFVETRRQWLAESAQAEKWVNDGNALGATPRLQKLGVEGRLIGDRLKQLAFQRLRILAGEELKEYKQNLNKMHIIEGEVIHRLAVDDRLKGQRSQLAKVEDQGDVLVFPYSSDEVWFDELDNYKARVKDCPTLKGASL